MRKVRRLFRQRKSTAYYVALFTMVGLVFGLGTLIISGRGLVETDEDLAVALHNSPVVMDEDHNQTPVGDVLLGKQAQAHTYPYCGTGSIWRPLDGVVHKISFVRRLSNGDHRVRAQHYFWSGTAYVKSGAPRYYTVDC